jgi:hypothetical protein
MSIKIDDIMDIKELEALYESMLGIQHTLECVLSKLKDYMYQITDDSNERDYFFEYYLKEIQKDVENAKIQI